MKNVITSIIVKRMQPDSNQQSSAKCDCNYQDNYYGDQTCIPVEKAG